MEITKLTGRITQGLKKYRYVLLVLLLGIVLMSIPSKTEQKVKQPERHKQTEITDDLQVRLAQVLSKIQGVGKVEVMLTQASGQEYIYQMDEDSDEDNDGCSVNKKTVILSDSSRNESALIKKTIPAQYLGAIIVCQGADRPQVRLALMEAVTKITGLGSDRIAIVKMD